MELLSTVMISRPCAERRPGDRMMVYLPVMRRMTSEDEAGGYRCKSPCLA
jgi:hypothetical protein